MNFLRHVSLGLLPAAAGAVLTFAAEPTAPAAKPDTPLSGLPSAAGPHLERIKVMADDSWLELGSPTADPKWGTARGRTWTPRMILAPELRGGFFMGTGVHAFVKPDGHYQDDLWFYDINAHRWICLYPGSPKDLKLTLDQRGFEVNEKGEPVPVDQTGHAVCNSTYDTDRRKFMFLPRVMPDYFWEKAVPLRKEWLSKGTPASCRHPWVYDPATCKWDRRFAEGQGPDKPACSLLEYVPPMKKAYFLYGKMWSYDWDSSKWTQHATKGDPSIPGYNFLSCYDSKRARIITMLSNRLWFYDPATDTGLNPKAKGQEEIDASPCASDKGNSCQESTLTYDAVNDVLVLYLHEAKKGQENRKGLYVYDCQANAWTTAPKGVPPEMAKLAGAVTAFYDPDLNVHFYFCAADSRDNGRMWAYRHKNARR